MENYIEHTVLAKALTPLEEHLGVGWKTTWTPDEEKNFGKTEVIIKQMGNEKYRATAFIQKEFRKQHFVKILDKRQRGDEKIIIVGEKIYPDVKEFLRERDIDYVDAAGNCRLHKDSLFIYIDGIKLKDHLEEIPNRAFTKTGLKVVFHLLLNDDIINLTYREIAKKTEVALGTIKFIINGLMEEGFLLRNNAGYAVIKKDELIDRWVTAYGERLKPALLIGRFRFLNPNDFTNWKELPLQKGKTLWGGEPAGELYTNYLKPGELTLYTTEKRNELIRNYKLIPDTEGNVVVLQKFWKIENEMDNKVPPILAYTDLVLARNNRCMEVAFKIHEQYLEKNI